MSDLFTKKTPKSSKEKEKPAEPEISMNSVIKPKAFTECELEKQKFEALRSNTDSNYNEGYLTTQNPTNFDNLYSQAKVTISESDQSNNESIRDIRIAENKIISKSLEEPAEINITLNSFSKKN